MTHPELSHGGYRTDLYRDFSVNVPTQADPILIEAFGRDLDRLHRYPYIDDTALRQQYTDHIGRPVVFGNGATQLIYAFVRALSPREAVLFEPTFSEYRHALYLNGTKIRAISRFADTYRLLKSPRNVEWSTSEPDLIVLCNPNNPTGCFWEIESMYDLLSRTRAHLLLDESFLDFVPALDHAKHHKALLQLMECFPERIAVLRSLTKSFSIPGVRAGYLFADPGLAERVSRQIEPWSLNRFAITALETIYRRYWLVPDRYREHRQAIDRSEERRLCTSRLEAMKGVRVYDSSANFLLFSSPFVDLNDRLHGKGFHIRSCSNFIGLGPHHYRIALLDKRDLEPLLDALAEIHGGQQ